MARLRCHAQCVKEKDGTAVERKSRECSRTENGQNGELLDTKAEALLGVEGAGCLAKNLHTEEPVSKFCFVFAKIALQLARREKGKKVESNIRLLSNGSLDAGELRRHVNRIDDCQRFSDDSRDQ